MSGPFSSEATEPAVNGHSMRGPRMIKRAVHGCGDCELLVMGRCVFTPKRLEAEEVLTPQDTLAREISFVRKGVVAITTVTSEGLEGHVAVRGPRTLLGLEALRALASPAEVRAVTDVQLCTAPAERVKAWLGGESGALRMFELAMNELIEQRRDVDFRSGRAEVRVARFLVTCAEHIGRGRDAPFSKARAAAVVGLRPETLSRVLRRLSARGLIDSSRGVRILDLHGLAAVAEG